MNKKRSGLDEWSDVKAIMSAKIREFYGGLDKAYRAADQTFAQRQAKADGILKALLADSQKLVQENYAFAQKQRAFSEALIAKSDQALQESVAALQSSSASDELAGAVAAEAEMHFAAQTTAGTVSIVVDALCLCGVLAGLLGHKEAVAFVEGAKKELLGAIFDPGTNVLTLLTRLYNVATRTLRADQDANELLKSLDMFQKLMKQWRVVMVNMSQGQPFAQAFVEAFKGLAPDATP